MDKWDYMKLKSFCTRKVSKLKRPPIGQEKIFTGYTSDEGLITRIHKKLKKLNSPKSVKWVTGLNRTFSKEEIKMDKKHMKKYLPSLAIKKCKSKPH
jgi:hypothetical protein